jgi:FtsZ-binding cell division protein ZapB
MEQNDLLTLNIPKIDGEDVKLFCKLNEVDNIDNFLYSCFKKGYYIEKYGLYGNTEPVFIDKIVEVPVEKIVEVEKIFHDESKLEEERQKFSTKIEEMEKNFQDLQKKNSMLSETLQSLRGQIVDKDKKISDLESVVMAPSPEFLKSRYMVGSNLSQTF